MYLRIGKAVTVLGVVQSTLRRWEKDEKLVADYRTIGGHRRYSFNQKFSKLFTIGCVITD